MRKELVQDGYCNTCEMESGDKYYIFCSIVCQKVWCAVNENEKKYTPDTELYNQWFENRTKTIEAMTTREEVENRITELQTIHFYTTREWSMLHQRFYKIVGHKGIPLHIQKQRDALITDPDINPNYSGEPRKKKTPKVKEDFEIKHMGIDIDALKQMAKSKMAEKRKQSSEKTESVKNVIQSMLEAKKPEISEEEKKEKLEAFKEKLRIAKENAQKKVG